MKIKEAIEWIRHDLAFTATEKYFKAHHMAIDALKKRMPMKANKGYDHTCGVEKEVPVCPSCGHFLGQIHFASYYDCEDKCDKVSYCEACGQAIDLSEVR